MTNTGELPDLEKGNIHLTGYIDVPAERLDAVLCAMNAHINLTHAEPGCVYFVIKRDKSNRCRLNVEEVFTDRAAFEYHQRRGAASHWADVTKGIERHFEIREI
ncbi:putative quinol monooxygenase [Ahrensia marina]|uniref:putative quinol monooxygenase n=1 Tax=Ahrensia marina TaxID=1514904 RepID=UPI0006B40BAA|nr:antibiotic biosynthesis monooxygenase [Ahrensia marina]